MICPSCSLDVHENCPEISRQELLTDYDIERSASPWCDCAHHPHGSVMMRTESEEDL